jgi:phage gp16-like protein
MLRKNHASSRASDKKTIFSNNMKLQKLFEKYQIQNYADYGKKDFGEVCEKCSYTFLGK